MKKLLIIISVLCILFGCAAVVVNLNKKDDSSITAAINEMDTETAKKEEAAASAVDADTDEEPYFDYDAFFASHDGNEVVMTVNGEDVTWYDYSYIMSSYAYNVEYYMYLYTNYYGMAMSWDDAATEDGLNYKEYAVPYTEGYFKKIFVTEKLVEEKGIELSEENLAAVEAARLEDMVSYCGEDATEEEFNAFLLENNLTREFYDRIGRSSYYFDEYAKTVTDEQAESFLKANGYYHCNHILFLYTNSETGEELSDEEKAALKEKAEELIAELRAIEDDEERYARFLELKEEYCEDGGACDYFTYPGAMVSEFETAANALQPYEISEPTESTYGIHIVIALPLDYDMTVTGDTYTGRMLAAEELYTEELTAATEKAEIEYKNGYENLNFSDFLV